MPYSESLNIA
ncbi:hypothetical protein VTN00DRAFT_2465 [Thermoascus crustaceus]